MTGIELVAKELSARKVDPERLAAVILQSPEALEKVVQEISTDKSRVKLACSKALVLLSEKKPDLLYGQVDEIIALLDNENQIVKWNAITMLGNMAAVDCDFRIKELLRKFHSLLTKGELITANTAIAALGKMALVFPDEQRRIVSQLLKIEHAKFQTDECRNIALGKVILAFEMFLQPGSLQKEILEFAARQTNNMRKATAEKARDFLRRYGQASAAG